METLELKSSHYYLFYPQRCFKSPLWALKIIVKISTSMILDSQALNVIKFFISTCRLLTCKTKSFVIPFKILSLSGLNILFFKLFQDD